MSSVISFLHQLLSQRLDAAQKIWLDSCVPEQLARFFSAAGRMIPAIPFELSSDERQTAEECVPGWMPWLWTLQDAVRCKLLLNTPVNAAVFCALQRGADLEESVALARSLAVLPDGAALEAPARRFVRSGIDGVLAALALNNPYPAQFLGEEGFNHLVAKSIAAGFSLQAIQGLTGRANPALTRVLLDGARERLSASRSVHPELWRAAVPAANQVDIAFISEFLAPIADDPEACLLAITQRTKVLHHAPH